MASYFDEHDCEPTNPEEQYRQNALLELARSLMQGLDLMDSGVFDVSDWEQRLPPPAAKTAVQTLTVVVISPEQADKGLKCPVCLLEFEEQETVREMPCKHLFHSGCILPWLGKTNSCPLCRLELPTDNPDYEEFKKDKERRKQREHRLEDLHGAMYTWHDGEFVARWRFTEIVKKWKPQETQNAAFTPFHKECYFYLLETKWRPYQIIFVIISNKNQKHHPGQTELLSVNWIQSRRKKIQYYKYITERKSLF